jgi:hypothetical protein
MSRSGVIYIEADVETLDSDFMVASPPSFIRILNGTPLNGLTIIIDSAGC